jgi:AraC-like DNA-binding protein
MLSCQAGLRPLAYPDHFVPRPTLTAVKGGDWPDLDDLDDMPDLWSFVKDNERRFVWCSKSMLRNIGLTNQRDVVGLRDEDLSPPYLADEYRRVDEKVIRHGQVLRGIPELVRHSYARRDGFISTKIPVISSRQKVIGLIGFAHRLTEVGPPSRPALPLEPALLLMYWQFHRRVTLPELARSVSMSPSQFMRGFHLHFGTTPHKYLRKLRLLAACDMLATTQLPLTVIANRSGYYDGSHLTHDFQREWKIPASSYRRRYSPSHLI